MAKKTPDTKQPKVVENVSAASVPPSSGEDAEAGRRVLSSGRGGVMEVFPTTMYVKANGGDKIQKMNHELEKFVLQKEKSSKSLTNSSIRGGHHSDRLLFDDPNWAVQELKALAIKHTQEYLKSFWANESAIAMSKIANFKLSISSWSMLMREGDWSVPHLHPRANLSGVYYVTTPECDADAPKGAGELVILDPRIRAEVFPIRDQISSVTVPAKAGAVVIFPSYLQHYVMPFKGKGHRISIAFNVSFSSNALQGY